MSLSPEPTPLTLREVAELVDGQLEPRREDDAHITVYGLTTLSEAGEGQLSFVSDAKYAAAAAESKAAALFAPEGLDLPGATVIRVAQVWGAVKRALERFHPAPEPIEFTAPSAVIGEGVRRGANVYIGHHAVIEAGAHLGDNARVEAGCFVGAESVIGAGTTLMPNVTILGASIIGRNCLIQPGAVIGGDGYKFELIDGVPTKIPQIGAVIIEDDVEVGANTTIDRASFTETRIGQGTKIDNLVMIAHNVRIGKYCMIVSQVGIAGSSKLGDGCILAGQVGVADNRTIGDGVTLAAKAGVMDDIPSGETWIGQPAQPFRDQMKQFALLRRLESIRKDVQELKKDRKS